MFPIYCNKCYKLQELERTLKFFISRCCHIACANCINGKCVVCERPYQGIEINSETMPSSVADCFADSMLILKRYERAVKFQCDQRTLLYKYNKTDQQKKLKELQQNNDLYTEGIRKIRELIEKEKKQIQTRKEYIAYQERRDEIGYVGDCVSRDGGGSCRQTVCSKRTPSSLSLTNQTNSSVEKKTRRENASGGGSCGNGGNGFDFML